MIKIEVVAEMSGGDKRVVVAARSDDTHDCDMVITAIIIMSQRGPQNILLEKAEWQTKQQEKEKDM